MSDLSFDSVFELLDSDCDFRSATTSKYDITSDLIDYDAELAAAESKIINIPINLPQPVLTPTHIEIDEYDVDNNVLDPNIRQKFASDLQFTSDMDLFSKPECTTITMGGLFANVKFKEYELITELQANEDVVSIKCNYGEVNYPGYTEPIKKKSSNRGRKKKAKNKKPRKISGTGKHFNSQLSFYVRSESGSPLIDLGTHYQIPADNPIYKFKVFRTGKIQLPGVRPHLIQDVIARSQCIARMLNLHLHTGVSDPSKLVRMMYINPVMKNYKFELKLPPGALIDMKALKYIMIEIQSGVSRGFDTKSILSDILAETPPIFDTKYTREDTKLSIKFNTPIYKNPKKCTRINVFMRGKVNILGAFDIDVTLRICKFLHAVFREYESDLIIDNKPPPVYIYDNIDNSSEYDLDDLVLKYIHCVDNAPKITTEDMNTLTQYIDRCYDEKLAADGKLLSSYFNTQV